MENEFDFQPCRGAIALCSRGELGLITSNGLVPVLYKGCVECYEVNVDERILFHSLDKCTCEQGVAWTGVHLVGDKAGQPWSSRTPRVVGRIREDKWLAPVGPAFIVDGRNHSRAFLNL